MLSRCNVKLSNTGAAGTYNFRGVLKPTIRNFRNETKEIPLEERRGPECFRRLRLPDFRTVGK